MIGVELAGQPREDREPVSRDCGAGAADPAREGVGTDFGRGYESEKNSPAGRT